MAKFIWILLLSISCLFAIGQNIKLTDIISKWVLNKYTETIKGKAVDRMVTNVKSVYVFSANGTYMETSQEGKDVFITKGRWKLTDKGRKVRLNNNIPNDPSFEIADHDLDVSFLDGRYYLTYTYGDVLNGPRTDYYKRSK